MTNRSIRFRGAALSDLDRIAKYTFEAFGTLAVSVYLDELKHCFTAISRHPELGVRFNKNVRRFAVGQHWIYYSSSTSSVRIIRILPQKALQVLRESLVVYGPLTKEQSTLTPEKTNSW
jgi:plasmid stabilization system protein ParE